MNNGKPTGQKVPLRLRDSWAIRARLQRGQEVRDLALFSLAMMRLKARDSLRQNRCTIYPDRPRACREYDCRLFAAAGIPAGVEAIDHQAQRWQFWYADIASERAHQAARAAAAFLLEHRSAFPGGRAPDRPADIAIVAAKSHHVF